jgi:gas vesicle protein
VASITTAKVRAWHLSCFVPLESLRRENDMKTAFVVGIAVGAAFALLYAPANGATTRTYLSEQARVGQRRANALFRKGRRVVESGRSRLLYAAEQGRECLQNVKEHVEEAVDEGREAASRIAAHGREAVVDVREGIGWHGTWKA